MPVKHFMVNTQGGIKIFAPEELEQAKREGYDKTVHVMKDEPEPFPEVTEHEVKFLQSRGYKVETIEKAAEFIEHLSPKERRGFFAEAAAWKEPKDGQEEETPQE